VKHITLICALMGATLTASAQQPMEGWEAGGWVGLGYYFGDLNTNFDLSLPGLSGGAMARYNFNERISIKGGLNAGTIRGDDAVSENTFERARNLSFKSLIIEGVAQLEFNFLPYKHGSEDKFFTPYMFAGLSAFHFNPEAKIDGQWVELQTLGTEGQFQGEEYSRFSGALLFGGGIKFDLSYEWSVNVEMGARTTFSDYLDDVSTTYPNLNTLRSERGELAARLSDRSIELPGVDPSNFGEEGRQRGDSSNNDNFLMLGVGLVYYFGDLRCPDYGK